ncbi:HalOD1 output domain-containing protein [Halorubrum amylolyticum]|uniref:HalOD1 output domain-containing protein n=1 Tax=Halorubrum amylolyticum TaxID=2508724 RepID=UPI0010087E5A|nr:HalOD1 output domain-containing protein [Halorubrum amylolyticum]
MSSVTSNSPGGESGSEAVRVEHGDDDGPAPSHAVVEAVAGAAGVDPIDLADEAGILLYDHIDLEALDALVASHSGADLGVSLSVADYEVSVDATAVVAEPVR